MLITDANNSHYVSIKDLDKFICSKTENKKKHFCRYCLQYFSSEKVLIENKKTYLEINGKQTMKLRISSIKFKNHFK